MGVKSLSVVEKDIKLTGETIKNTTHYAHISFVQIALLIYRQIVHLSA